MNSSKSGAEGSPKPIRDRIPCLTGRTAANLCPHAKLFLPLSVPRGVRGVEMLQFGVNFDYYPLESDLKHSAPQPRSLLAATASAGISCLIIKIMKPPMI